MYKIKHLLLIFFVEFGGQKCYTYRAKPPFLSMRNIRINQIANDLRLSCAAVAEIRGYAIDSRLASPGDLFFALPGEKTDGHQFLSEVSKRGGVAAVVASSYEGMGEGLILLKVPDVASALRELSRIHLARTNPKIIGVTGSVGKTTTKEFIATLLEAKYRVLKNVGSYNTKLTLPLTILNNQGNEEVFVLEMGMSQKGDIRNLVDIAAPDIAVVTKVALAHAEFFPGGLPEIVQGKLEIAQHPKTKVAILDHELVEANIPHAQKVTISTVCREADYFLEGTAIVERHRPFCLPAIPFQEAHICHNMLAAIAAARHMQMTWEEIAERLPHLRMPPMRFTCVEKQGIRFINDAYNANPASMRAALQSLPKPKAGNRTIAVLGSMKELGAFSESSHREIGHLAAQCVDAVLALGVETQFLCQAFCQTKPSAEWFENRQDLVQRLREMTFPGDVILIKGSRSMQMEKVLECF